MSSFVDEFIKQILLFSFVDIIKPINEITKLVLGSSILSIVFKYFITYPVVGYTLVIIKYPKGKKGSILGKILYFVIGYAIGFFLDYIAEIIF